MRSFEHALRNPRIQVAILLLFMAGPALAWDAEVYIDRLEDSFYVDTFSGNYSWTTQQEGLRAESGSGSIPINRILQQWDGSVWPSDIMGDAANGPSVSAYSNLEHYDGTSDEFFDYAQAGVYGDIDPGMAFGGSWNYDFHLTLDPFTTVSLYLDGDGAYGYLASEPGDDGNAFIGIRLYSPDLPLNDPGGVNDPYASDTRFLVAPPTGGEIDTPLTFTALFTNSTSQSVVYNLRLEGAVSIFETVPEPTALMLITLGFSAVLRRKRR